LLPLIKVVKLKEDFFEFVFPTNPFSLDILFAFIIVDPLQKINHPRISSFLTFIPIKLSFSANSPSIHCADVDDVVVLLVPLPPEEINLHAKYTPDANNVIVDVDPMKMPFARDEELEELVLDMDECIATPESKMETEMVPKERNANVNPPFPPPDPPVLLLLVLLLLSRIIQTRLCVCTCCVCVYSMFRPRGSFRENEASGKLLFLDAHNKREEEEEDEKKRAAKWTPMFLLFVIIPTTTENHSLFSSYTCSS